jgi:hypothetical protein
MPFKGKYSTPADPLGNKTMLWIRDVALTLQTDLCVGWPFTRIRTGYGRFGRQRKNIYAHRYICEWAHGPAPTPKHQASHSCGNGHLGCVNPRHLSWKTNSENQLERREHGTAKNGKRWKLTPAQVAEIRAAEGQERTDIVAARYGIRESTVRGIQKRVLWPTGDYSTGRRRKQIPTHTTGI